MKDSERLASLVALLREAGVGGGASVAGAQADIAVVHDATPAEVQPLEARIRELGFRHVTVDLDTVGRESRG